jgi:carbon monoxide dehydrogenase subunit G
MIRKTLIALAAIVVVFVAIVAMQPSEYRVARTATIAAPAAAVFSQVNDFHKWEAWSPWANLDPAMRQAYEGAPAGTGAIYTWAGNNEVGEGRMTLTESHPSDRIRIKLEFLKPFAATSVAEFTFKPEGNHTAVTWSMTGNVNFVAKAVHLFMNMDRMIGDNFEKGLARLKSITEGAQSTARSQR